MDKLLDGLSKLKQWMDGNLTAYQALQKDVNADQSEAESLLAQAKAAQQVAYVSDMIISYSISIAGLIVSHDSWQGWEALTWWGVGFGTLCAKTLDTVDRHMLTLNLLVLPQCC